MKPRIFLFSDHEQSTIELFTSLIALESYPFNFSDTKYFLHVGFNPPASAGVKDLLHDLPIGFYCSIGFKEASPGGLWKFGDVCGKLDEMASVIPVLNAPIINFEVLEQTIDSLKPFQKKYAERASISQISIKSGVEIGDEKLADYEFTVRTTNVFIAENIVFLSDLLKFSESELLRCPNFGRKSLREVKAFLEERDLTLNQANISFSAPIEVRRNPKEIVGDSAERDISEEIAKLGDQRTVEILRARVGFGKRKTLQTLGVEFGITRERVRQIEAKGIQKILKKPNNLFSMWNELILEHVQNSIYPIEIEKFTNLERAFEAVNVRSGWLIRFLIGLNKRNLETYSNGLSLIEFQGKQLVSEFSQEDFDEFHKLILEIFSNSNRKPLNILKAECYKFCTDQKEKYFNLIFEHELSNSLVSRSGDGSEVFVKYVRRSNIEIAMQLLIDHVNAADGPIKTEELQAFVEKKTFISYRSISNALNHNDDIFPYRHGYWTTFQHLDFTEADKRLIVEAANLKLVDQAYTQLHCRDLAEELSGRLSTELNYFAIAGILKKFSDLTYLGRSVFCAKGAQLEQRFFIHDALVNVLRARDRPMHINELIDEAREFVSISDAYQPATKAPIINIGNSTYALDYWDI